MKRVQQSLGHIRVPDIKPDADGTLGPAAILRLSASVVSLVTTLNGKLQCGSGAPNADAGNLDGLFLQVFFPSTADTEVTIPHDLGRPPGIAIPVFKDRACDVYSMRGPANVWGDNNKAYFACNVANAKVTLLVM